MELDKGLVHAVRMIPFYKTLAAEFSIASTESPVDVVAGVEKFIDEGVHMTGVRPTALVIQPSQHTFKVEASPLLIRMLMDHGPGYLSKATLG